MRSYDSNQHFWAKIDEEYWHPLLAHSTDVAAVVERLLSDTVLGARLGQQITGPFSDAQRERLLVLALYHDAGKANAKFQRFEAGHLVPIVSQAGNLIDELNLREMQPWFEDTTSWLFSAWSHHGRPVHPDSTIGFSDYWTGTSRQKLSEFPEWARLHYPKAFREARPITGARAQHLFVGILTLADWIASDEQFFPYTQAEEPDLTDPKVAMNVSRERAEKAVECLRLAENIRSPNTNLSAVLGGFDPYEVQQRMQGLSTGDSGTLTILESPTGSGKTEAVVGRFAELLDRGEVDSMYFALPTRSAAKQLHDRLTAIAERIFDSPPPVHLAVPGYLRADDHEGQRFGRDVYWAEMKNARGWAVESSKRYTASPIAVGTVDQVLLSALKCGHANLRGSALARSFLVVDEVHASDAYMQKILDQVLDMHVSGGGHAALMSATLGSSARAHFTDRKTPSFEEAVEEGYPRITHLSEEGTESRSPSLPGSESKTVSLETAGIMEQTSRIAARAAQAARQGAQVLIIRNTVRECQRTFGCLPEDISFSVEGLPCPHHSRYVGPDRRQMDRQIERLFGEEDRRPDEGLVCVATQTVEQSLDIDADYMITDLCPMDVLLQRLGRLHRHHRPGERPHEYEDAQCLIATPSSRDLSNRINSDGGGYAGAGLGYVYPDLRIIEATWRSLSEHPVITVPEDNRMLVEEATHPEVLRSIEEGPEWQAHAEKISGERRQLRQRALNNLVDFDKLYSKQQYLEGKISTRPGAETVVFELPGAVSTPFGNDVESVSISPLRLDEPESFSQLEIKALESRGRGFSFEVAGKQFEYTEIGLHVT